MQDRFTFYQSKIKEHHAQLAKVKQDLSASSILRLFLFLITATGIYICLGNIKLVLAVLILGVGLFLYLVSRHTDLQYRRDKLEALIGINKVELEVLKYEFYTLPEGNEFKDPQHHYSQDIDLFGKGSFYQYINRTALQQGSETLAAILTANAIDSIGEKQEAIQELSKMPEWRQEFSAIASLVKTDTSYAVIIQWMDGYVKFLPSFMKTLPLVFSILSGVLFRG